MGQGFRPVAGLPLGVPGFQKSFELSTRVPESRTAFSAYPAFSERNVAVPGHTLLARIITPVQLSSRITGALHGVRRSTPFIVS